jgi:hypothetical protein
MAPATPISTGTGTIRHARLSSLIGNNDFRGCALKLGTRLLGLMRLRRRSQDDERQDDNDVVSPSAYPSN